MSIDLNKDYFKEFDELYKKHQYDNMIDFDGYPSEISLKLIEIWRWDEPEEWFKFIKDVWYLSDMTFKELITDNKHKRYEISTGGWSGNESIIESMMKNHILWSTTFLSLYRGGHYTFDFELDEYDR